jgi:signal transduction histidine kinase
MARCVGPLGRHSLSTSSLAPVDLPGRLSLPPLDVPTAAREGTMDDTTDRLNGPARGRTFERSDQQSGAARGGVIVAALPRVSPSTGSRDEDRREPAHQGGGAIRLAAFITANQEAILAEWEAFARTRGAAGGGMDVAALRDHAAEMLTVIAADLNTPQGPHAQAEKAKGRTPGMPHAAVAGADRLTAAAEHGAGRAESGFTVEQMVSEFRALRASVVRLWTAARAVGAEGVARAPGVMALSDQTHGAGDPGALDGEAVDDLTRFHEAIDQALAESVARYTQDIDESKEMFLAILGHDLRTPLGATLTASRFMLETEELPEPHATLTARIASSSTRMLQMVGDLLDFTRSRLGGGIPIVRAEVNVGKVVHDVVDELAAAHPRRRVTVDGRGADHAMWDAARITQALANLLGNALEHGLPSEPVGVEIHGTADDVTIAIHNYGPTIPARLLEGLFRPMKGREARANAAATGPLGNLGLGLYIADRIVHAHHGSIAVDSPAEWGTTFTVHLPRHA